jgi:nucleotide-binding universal stress UspA family protein
VNKVEKLHRLVSHDAALWCEPRYIVEQGVPAEKILHTANSLGADLIVLGAQPATWMATHLNAGTVQKVVAGAKCPVLTVHD